MKTTKTIFFVGLWVAVTAAVAGMLIARHQPAPQSDRETKSRLAVNVGRPVATSAPATTAAKVLPSAATGRSVNTASAVPPERSDVPTNDRPQAVQAPADQGLSYNGYEVHDPMARVALYGVGTDPEADAYWETAIDDSNLPAEERKDLIEDLNETGLSEPQHPGPADLPLITARIRLIERLAPYSIDEVNAKAFAEAYKDLVGMANGQAPH
jgi:hypothetical protein